MSSRGSAGTTAGAPSLTASATASTVSTGTSGRAASWMSTEIDVVGQRVETERVRSPDGSPRRGRPGPRSPGRACSSSRRRTSAAPAGGATTTTRETERERAIARTAWTSIGVPLSSRSALGAPGPRRRPRPAAGITAAVRCGRGDRPSVVGRSRSELPPPLWIDIGSYVQVCVLGRHGYGLACRARRLDRPFRDSRSSQLPGPGTPQIGGRKCSDVVRLRPHGVRLRHAAAPGDMTSSSGTAAVSITPDRYSLSASLVGKRSVTVTGVRTREPRRGGPRPCPRSCSPRARARSPGSGAPSRACASHPRKARAHAHDATGRARLRRP